MVGPSSMSRPIEMRCDESSVSQRERRDASAAEHAIGEYARRANQRGLNEYRAATPGGDALASAGISRSRPHQYQFAHLYIVYAMSIVLPGDQTVQYRDAAPCAAAASGAATAAAGAASSAAASSVVADVSSAASASGAIPRPRSSLRQYERARAVASDLNEACLSNEIL
ncbi:unnamed protein product [Trichogramma brassicae]|uniref:Uncharacterized protein n=1 Tax=Trichogramma brassicae TaxID=86971 RepID=A0A6H5IWS7_9HYME|nr:unnamed protein product [Trichogramma brassicae]